MTDASRRPNDGVGSFPVPPSISSVAQEQLAAMMALEQGNSDIPDGDAGWAELAALADEMLLGMLPDPAEGTRVTGTELGGVPVHEVEPERPGSDQICLYLHGGAFLMGLGRFVQP